MKTEKTNSIKKGEQPQVQKTVNLGTEVFVDPMVNVTGESHWRKGRVTYVNKENGWFLVEYKSNKDNYTMKSTYRFYDIGKLVFLEYRDINVPEHSEI